MRTVAMSTPDKNALSTTLMRWLIAELRAAAGEPILLTGTGNVFSAGLHLKEVTSLDTAGMERYLATLEELVEALFNYEGPTIAWVNGHAIAGGCVLACCADRRVMANDGGRIGVTEILVGVPFPALAFEIVRFAVPLRYLPEFTLSGATYVPKDALQRGWVDEVIEPGELMSRAMAAAQSLAALSPPAFAQTKMQIRAPVTERMAQSGEATDKSVAEIWTAPATVSYIRDYVARTLKKA